MPYVKGSPAGKKTTLAVVFSMLLPLVTLTVSQTRPHAGAEVDHPGGAQASISAVMAQAKTLPRLVRDEEGKGQAPAGTEIAVQYGPVGVSYASVEADRQMPALSLIKLYIGHYVEIHGTEKEKAKIGEMISGSSDAIAAQFYRAYPNSVDEVAAEFGLGQTFGGLQWGVSRTSVNDVVAFVSTLRATRPESMVLAGMRDWQRVAIDGYRQDFGLARLRGIEGAKRGWSNQRTVHSSVVFGPGYVIAAITLGGRNAHNQAVATALEDADLEPVAPQNSRKKSAATTPRKPSASASGAANSPRTSPRRG